MSAKPALAVGTTCCRNTGCDPQCGGAPGYWCSSPCDPGYCDCFWSKPNCFTLPYC
ncbi:MAG TPA: hypothetical protein VHJ34_14310 [Actinomycetota bacterium]|nr:hypothetical protein [Actinomycetota bacterium]